MKSYRSAAILRIKKYRALTHKEEDGKDDITEEH